MRTHHPPNSHRCVAALRKELERLLGVRVECTEDQNVYAGLVFIRDCLNSHHPFFAQEVIDE